MALLTTYLNPLNRKGTYEPQHHSAAERPRQLSSGCAGQFELLALL